MSVIEMRIMNTLRAGAQKSNAYLKNSWSHVQASSGSKYGDWLKSWNVVW